MSVKIQSLSLDSLVLSSDNPKPLPLPLLSGVPISPQIFSNNWTFNVQLETRWLTDVTRSAGTARPEKWVDASRPSRVLSVQILGASRDESHAILQAAQAFTGMFGCPVPIYCDARTIKSVESGGTILRGDFRYRRFFQDGRVAIFPTRVIPSRSANSCIFARIVEINADWMRIAFEPGMTRTPVALLDAVAPCMDVEMVDSISGVSMKDDIFEVNLSWREVEAECTLPGLWPPTTYDNSEILSPFCKIVDGLPVFPFELDWSEGVSIDSARTIDSTPSGRSSIQEPRGLTYQRLRMRVFGTREKTWNVLRFFDSMQGRAGTFYLIHPHRPWSLLSVPTVSKAHIRMAGDANHLKQYFPRAALFRADGTFITRKISSTIDTGTEFQLFFQSDLPDTDFVEIQPIFESSFENDNITESWANDETALPIELTVITEPDRGEVSISNGIAYQERSHSFLEIPGNNALFRAGAGDGHVAWPAGNSGMSQWTDSSRGPSRAQEVSQLPRRMRREDSAPLEPELIRFPQGWQNNGEVSIFRPWFNFTSQLDNTIPVAERHLWGSTGWTLLLCFTPQLPLTPQSDREILRIGNFNTDSIAIYVDKVGTSGSNKAGVRRYSGVSTVTDFPFTVDISELPYTVFLTLRWSGSTLHAWVNGVPAFSAPQSVSLFFPAEYTISRWFQGFYTSETTSAFRIANSFQNRGCANLIASYSRPLDVAELNKLHTLVADIYRAPVTTSSIY